MRPPRHIEVPIDQVKPGEEYTGYHYKGINYKGEPSDFICHGSVTIGEDGTPLSWGEYPIKKEITCFLRDMTWKEEEEWYINQTDMTHTTNQLNLMGLHHDMYDIGDAFHEMWNGWIHCEWHEQLTELVDEDFFIIGIAPAPYGCFSIDDPVAIVAEYRGDGTRFWCHASQDWITTMREESMDEYRKLMGGT